MDITIDAIVIKVMDFKGDRILTLLSKEYGILSAYARSAKSPKSKLASSTEQFCFSRFVLSQKGDKYFVETADVYNVFFGIRNDIVKLSIASYLCELSYYLAPKAEDAYEYLRLLLNSLHFLCEDTKTATLIKALFEMRIMTMSGFMPDLVGCQVCGNFEGDYAYFSSKSGEIICNKCFEKSAPKDFVPISMGVLSAMRHIIYSPFDKLFSFTISSKSEKILYDISEDYTLTHIDFIPKTLSFLTTINKL